MKHGLNTDKGRRGDIERLPDAASSQHTLDLIDQAEAIIGVRKGLESIQRDEGIPAEEVFKQLRAKHNFPQDA